VRLEKRATVGAKRNVACGHARGSIIAHWDDDDWHAPHRLSYQVEALLRAEADVCGISTLLFYDVQAGAAWRYTYPRRGRAWLSGSTLCYRRAFWERNPFADINVGEDGAFVGSAAARRIQVLSDPTFHVGMIHGGNVSPKRVHGVCWRSYAREEITRLLGSDWPFYHTQGKDTLMNANASELTSVQASEQRHDYYAATDPPPGVRNIFACLVHENIECVIDMVRNLRYLDPASTILLYDGSPRGRLLTGAFPFESYGAVLHPSPKPQRWGQLHGFALDCMNFALDNLGFDTLTIVDSDQLGVRPGYSNYIARTLAPNSNIGLLGNSPDWQPPNTKVGPVVAAYRERELWGPLLRRFPRGEESFAYWTFWPSTVFTADAARDLVKLFATDEQLQGIMRRSAIWATEEVIFPTLVALLGYKIAANPCSYEYVKYKQVYNATQVEAGINRQDVYWIHPVARRYDDPRRVQVRERHGHYQGTLNLAEPRHVEDVEGEAMSRALHQVSVREQPRLLLTKPILNGMSKVAGWLDEDEADLLIAAGRAALTGSEGPHNVVEVGSFCGRATVVLASVMQALCPDGKVWAIDLHDGKVGSLDRGIEEHGPTLDRFRRSINEAGVERVVEVVRARSSDVSWEKPVSLLLIDGLHDYSNVSRDFLHFERWLLPGGYVAFHDYADYYPEVKTFVHEVLGTGRYERVECVRSLILLRKVEDRGKCIAHSESLPSTAS
jgi:hypothetical protein